MTAGIEPATHNLARKKDANQEPNKITEDMMVIGLAKKWLNFEDSKEEGCKPGAIHIYIGGNRMTESYSVSEEKDGLAKPLIYRPFYVRLAEIC